MARWAIFLLILLLPGLAQAQITDRFQTSQPFGLVAASASGAACVYPPSTPASCVKLDYQGYQGVAALLKGTWAGTVVGELSADGGTTWTAVNLVSSAGVSAASVTASGLYSPAVVAGAQIFQVRVSAYTSGQVDVVLRGTLAQARGNAATATALAADPADCAAGTVALGIVASGAATCTATPSLTSLGIGVASPATVFGVSSSLTSSPRGIMSGQFNTGTDGARLHMRKARGTEASPVVIVSGDNLGRLVASGYDGNSYEEMAGIIFGTEGTIADTRVPTNIIFQTATNASPSVLTTALTIDSAQRVTIGTEATISVSTVGLQISGGPTQFTMNSSSTDGTYAQIGNTASGGKIWLLGSSGGGLTTAGNYLLYDASNGKIALAVLPNQGGAVFSSPVTIGNFTPTAITNVRVYAASLTPAQLAAAVGATEEAFTVAGLTTADKVFVNGPAPTALCPPVGYRVSAADTLSITFVDLTIALCTPAAGTYNIVAVRS